MTPRDSSARDERDPYERLARYYDLGHASFDDDLDFYDALARRLDAPVLELGAGTGRLAVELARRGRAVTGIERSAAMLAIARRKAEAAGVRSLMLVEGDMRAPDLNRRFGLILCAIDTFLHLESSDDQLATLTAARSLLAPTGLVVIDLPGPGGDWGDWAPGARPLVLAWSVADGEQRISRYTTFHADPAAQRRHVIDIFEEVDRTGAVRREFVEYDLRFVFPAEAELLLRLAGLRLRARYGDYELGPFDADSPRLLLLAEAAT